MGTRPDRRQVFYQGRGVFDGASEVVRAGDGVLVDGDRVAGVGSAGALAGPGVLRRDLGDGVIVPGFVDAHTHVTIRPGEGDQHGQLVRPAAWQTIRGVGNLRRMLLSGVTTARIMTEEHGIDFEFRDAIARGEVAGPRLLVSGPGLSPPGGHGSAARGVAGPAPLRKAVRQRAERGADHIKIFTTGGVSSVNSSLAESNYSAQLIGELDVGVLGVGSRADFAVLDGDPFEDITAVRRVRAVYRAGALAGTDSGDACGVPQSAAGRNWT
jgi:imidazolonepropionase-like amidohydrolase